MSETPPLSVTLRVRMSEHDAHYGGRLVDGARILALFGDAATELCIGNDGDEGLFRAYSEIEFLAPIYAGDFIEVVARLTAVGRTSRKMEFEAYKVIQASYTADNSSSAVLLGDPILVVRAQGTCVVLRERQHKERT